MSTATLEDLLTVTNSEGRTFNVRLVRVGENFGRDDCLTHGAAMFGRPAKPDALPMIEFYDASQDPEKFGQRGQFVSRYYFDTLADSVRGNRGLLLDAGIPVWFVDADNVREAFTWAAVQVAKS